MEKLDVSSVFGRRVWIQEHEALVFFSGTNQQISSVEKVYELGDNYRGLSFEILEIVLQSLHRKFRDIILIHTKNQVVKNHVSTSFTSNDEAFK